MLTLAADVFFVDGTPFLLTVARRLKFVMAEHVPVRTATNLSKHIKRVFEVYKRAGFIVRTILMDGEFEKIKPLLPTVECNTTAAKEHVSKAERTIRTLKEQKRGLLATLPLSNMPRRMKISLFILLCYGLMHFRSRAEFRPPTRPESSSCAGNWTTKSTAACFPGRIAKCRMSPFPQTRWRGVRTSALLLARWGICRGA
jgi:hypothetical protein